MLIRIRYTTGTFDYVSPTSLNDLIATKAITQFFRSGSWAVIGKDPIRTERSGYTGRERRGAQRIKPLVISLTKPLIKKGLYASLIILALMTSTLMGTVLSAMFCPSVEIEDPYSEAEINLYAHK